MIFKNSSQFQERELSFQRLLPSVAGYGSPHGDIVSQPLLANDRHSSRASQGKASKLKTHTDAKKRRRMNSKGISIGLYVFL